MHYERPLPIPVRATELPDERPSEVHLNYHQPAFELLHEKLGDQIEYELLVAPARLRADFLKSTLPLEQTVDSDTAWRVCQSLLQHLEDALCQTLSHRSVFFWIHLYRRIGVKLHPEHEEKTDPRTTFLVRNILELAIIKFGRLDRPNDVRLSNHITAEKILGGYFRQGLKRMFPTRFSRMLLSFKKSFRERPQWVIGDFSDKDFTGIYRAEGLAYQYWRTTALMRGLGKGCQMILDDAGDWRIAASRELCELIESIDARTEESPLESSLVGTWFEGTTLEGQLHKSPTDRIIGVVYNVYRHDSAPFLTKLGLPMSPGYTTNFLPVIVDLKQFLVAHHFMADAYRARHQLSLDAFVGTIGAISHTLSFPQQMWRAKSKDESQRIYLLSLSTLLQRGYKVLGFDREKTAEETARRILTFAPEARVSPMEAAQALDLLTLTPAKQRTVSLWSGGPRFMLIPHGDQMVIDLQGIPAILFTLFVRVAHDGTLRGTVFEETFRAALKEKGYEVVAGKLRLDEKTERELDAGVRLGTRLVLFECISAERPLDYEIGRPETLASRKARLDEKIDQVLSLEQFLRKNPVGRTYDFTWAEDFVSFVVSPFVEWAWERSPRLWLPDGTPRIVSAREAIRYLDRSG